MPVTILSIQKSKHARDKVSDYRAETHEKDKHES